MWWASSTKPTSPPSSRSDRGAPVSDSGEVGSDKGEIGSPSLEKISKTGDLGSPEPENLSGEGDPVSPSREIGRGEGDPRSPSPDIRAYMCELSDQLVKVWPFRPGRTASRMAVLVPFDPLRMTDGLPFSALSIVPEPPAALSRGRRPPPRGRRSAPPRPAAAG